MTGPFASGFARTVTVSDAAGVRKLRAFLQPLSVNHPEAPKVTAAGIADPRRWLLILEEAVLRGPVEISDGTDVYALTRWEKIGGHIEGVLIRKGGAADA